MKSEGYIYRGGVIKAPASPACLGVESTPIKLPAVSMRPRTEASPIKSVVSSEPRIVSAELRIEASSLK